MSAKTGADVYNIPAKETEPVTTNHFNGSPEEVSARFCIQELCKAWPVYRDFSEWNNYRSIFTKEGADVYTTWSGRLDIDDFIAVSKKGRANGDFIAHRENGTLANVNLEKQRGLGKMKATITQRFIVDDIPIDIDCDCRFIFFCRIEDGQWKAQHVKLFYEKDKISPIDGKTLPEIKPGELDGFTEGYKYLGWAQAKLGHKILPNLPNANNKGFHQMYDSMAAWLQGEEVELNWEK